MPRWAVIGASSFSGGAFMRYLKEKGEQAVGLSRPAHDLNDRHAIPGVLFELRPDYVVNFAALNMVGESWRHAADYYQTNVVGTSRLLDWLAGCEWLKKYVHVSTPEVYGSTGASLTEDAPFRPSTPYAVSRASADLHARCLHAVQGLPVVFTRSVNVYGPGQQLYRIIPKTVLAILAGRRITLDGGGASSRSFIHIDDVCEATYRVALRGRAGEAYHTSTLAQTSIRGLVRMICERMGAQFEKVAQDGPERPGKDMNYQLDSSRIRSELGWRDTIRLEDGLAATIDWYRKRPWLKDQSAEYEHRA